MRLLLDCGFGAMHRMATLNLRWQDITHVALTHFHADHIGELPNLIMALRWGQLPPRSEPLTVYGPIGTGDIMEKLAAVYGAWMLSPGFPLTFRELQPDEVVRIGESVKLSAHPVPHAAESVAYSIDADGKRLVYTGDTSFDEKVGEWAAGCDLLLTECSLPDSLAIKDHLTPSQAGALAQSARTKHLVLTHFYPPVEQVDISAEVAEHYKGQLTLASDGWSIEL